MKIDIAQTKTLSFDGDGTLWDFETVMKIGLRKVLDALKQAADSPKVRAVSVEDLIEIRNELARDHPSVALDHELLRRRSFGVLLERLEISDDGLAEQLAEIFFTYRFGTIVLYDDTLAALSKLRRRYRVGLTSNGNNDPKRFGLEGYFDFTVFSEACGFAKPHSGIFREMLKCGGCAAHQAIHIGDSLLNDVRGAQSSGIQTIWLNRTALPNHSRIVPDATIGNLQELVDMMG